SCGVEPDAEMEVAIGERGELAVTCLAPAARHRVVEVPDDFVDVALADRGEVVGERALPLSANPELDAGLVERLEVLERRKDAHNLRVGGCWRDRLVLEKVEERIVRVGLLASRAAFRERLM